MLNLAEYRKRPALLADYLPWACLVAPGVILNKDGSFQRSARFRGPDLESATEAELVATWHADHRAERRRHLLCGGEALREVLLERVGDHLGHGFGNGVDLLDDVA